MFNDNSGLQAGIGYFGASLFDCEKISVGCTVRSISIFLTDKEALPLSLDGIEFYAKSIKLNLQPEDYKLEQSSIHQGRGPERLLEGKRIHTLSEKSSFWKIRFTQPIFISQVFLFNRRDFYAYRNASLCLKYETLTNESHDIVLNQHRPLSSIVYDAWAKSTSDHRDDSLYQYLLRDNKLNNYAFNYDKYYTGSRHFGAIRKTAAFFEFKPRLNKIVLTLACKEARFLSLDGIEFLKNGKIVKPTPGTYSLYQSSLHKERGPERLLNMKRIHTLEDIYPYWCISFNEPVEFDGIRVFNRNDTYSRRNIGLICNVTFADGTKETISSEANNDSLLNIIIDHLQLLDSKELWLHFLGYGFSTGVLDIFSFDWLEVINYINIWDEGHILDESEAIILSAYAISAKKAGQNKLKAFEARLRTKLAIEFFEQNLNFLSKVYGFGQYRLTKHGLIQANLVSEASSYLASIDEFVSDLKKLNYTAFISYGTLLGARRENAFLAHDDDVDMILPLRANNEPNMQTEFTNVLAELELLGYKIKNVKNHPNVHVSKRGFKRLDIFPCWSDDKNVYLLMERMKIRSLPKDMIFPLKPIEFQGYEFLSPSQTDCFLTERYGSNWTTPDKFHEWPWKLSEKEGNVDNYSFECIFSPLNLFDKLLEELKPYQFVESGWRFHKYLHVLDCKNSGRRITFDFHFWLNSAVMVCAFDSQNDIPFALSKDKNLNLLPANLEVIEFLSEDDLLVRLSAIVVKSLTLD